MLWQLKSNNTKRKWQPLTIPSVTQTPKTILNSFHTMQWIKFGWQNSSSHGWGILCYPYFNQTFYIFQAVIQILNKRHSQQQQEPPLTDLRFIYNRLNPLRVVVEEYGLRGWGPGIVSAGCLWIDPLLQRQVLIHKVLIGGGDVSLQCHQLLEVRQTVNIKVKIKDVRFTIVCISRLSHSKLTMLSSFMKEMLGPTLLITL